MHCNESNHCYHIRKGRSEQSCRIYVQIGLVCSESKTLSYEKARFSLPFSWPYMHHECACNMND